MKLLSLGLGDDFDRIQILSDLLSSEVCASIHNKDIVNRRNVINSFFEDFLTNFNSEQIGDLFNKIVKQFNESKKYKINKKTNKGSCI